MTPNHHVTSTFVHTVDADPAEAREVLTRVDPMRSLADRLSALGLDDRTIWSRSGDLAYTLVWRFGRDQGHARLDWRLELDANGAGGTTLTLKVSARASDAAARARVLRAWLLVEELARGLAARLARMLEDYPAEDEYGEVPLLRAVG